MKEAQRFSTTVGRDTITIETGKLAGQANGAVTVRLGDTIILTTATMAKQPREGIDFFPLSVEYEERLYAAGRIPGSFFRREGRPGEASILICRLTDRPLRPLFPDDFRNDVQVVITSLSSDGEHQIDILAINGASAALTISDIPFHGPVGAVRVGRIDGELVINPTASELDHSTLDLRIAGTKDAILMVECGANELPGALMVQALDFGHKSLQEGFDYLLPDATVRKAVIEWAGVGVSGRRVSLAQDVDPNPQARVFLPAGAKGPAFLVFENFEAILKYNQSTSYAAVSLLSDRLAGREEPILAEWPRNDRALSLSERKARSRR